MFMLFEDKQICERVCPFPLLATNTYIPYKCVNRPSKYLLTVSFISYFLKFTEKVLTFDPIFFAIPQFIATRSVALMEGGGKMVCSTLLF